MQVFTPNAARLCGAALATGQCLTMPLLEIRDASFMRGGTDILASCHVVLERGGHATYVCHDASSASLVARIAAGIIKPSTGNVLIGDYDAAIQPVQAKGLLGFVPARLHTRSARDFEAYIRYRAALWSVELELAMQRAYCARSILEPIGADFAATLAGALISAPSLVVIDQPPKGSAAAVTAAIGSAALFTTHTCGQEASAWAL